MASLYDLLKSISDASMTKREFGRKIHSYDKAEVQEALEALENAGGYENLEE